MLSHVPCCPSSQTPLLLLHDANKAHAELLFILATHHKPQCCCCTMTDTKSGLNPTPLAQIPIQAKVLCSQRGNSSSNQSSCGISIRQLALLKPLLRSEPGAPVLPSQTAELFFEAAVTFNHYPWPEWSSAADASKDVMVSNGDVPPCV